MSAPGAIFLFPDAIRADPSLQIVIRTVSEETRRLGSVPGAPGSFQDRHPGISGVREPMKGAGKGPQPFGFVQERRVQSFRVRLGSKRRGKEIQGSGRLVQALGFFARRYPPEPRPPAASYRPGDLRERGYQRFSRRPNESGRVFRPTGPRWTESRVPRKVTTLSGLRRTLIRPPRDV